MKEGSVAVDTSVIVETIVAMPDAWADPVK